MGYDPNGAWRIYKLRPDFNPADKVQVEDDITASVVLPRESLSNLDPEYSARSVKLLMPLLARVLATNLNGVYFTCKHAVRAMLA